MDKTLKRKIFGRIDGREISLFTLKNKNDMEVKITNYGAIITSIKVPTKHGKIEAVLGFETLEEYLSDQYLKGDYPYFGALIGRNAGRVRNGSFMLDGVKVELTKNIGENQLHGGFKGFDRRVWEVEHADKTEVSITLKYISKDGEEGYPGNLTTRVTYTLTDDNELKIDYDANTDADTVINLTQHTYFNFNKGDSGTVKEHKLQVNASQCLPLNKDLTPMGVVKDVANYHLDFRLPSNVPEDIDSSFVRDISEDEVIGSLECKETNIKMEVKTNYPILHIYSGFYIPEMNPENRKATGKNAGVCFEAQRYPDALNHPLFPSNKLSPGEEYKYHTIFKFYF